jgi:hypothetical protein
MVKPTLKVVRATRDAAAVPAHLGDAGRELWTSIQGGYQITDPGGRALLCTAAEAADRIKSVRSQIDAQGELLTIRGIPRVNPLCAVERDARAALIRALKELHLDLEPLRDRPGRPEGPRWSGVKESW